MHWLQEKPDEDSERSVSFHNLSPLLSTLSVHTHTIATHWWDSAYCGRRTVLHTAEYYRSRAHTHTHTYTPSHTFTFSYCSNQAWDRQEASGGVLIAPPPPYTASHTNALTASSSSFVTREFSCVWCVPQDMFPTVLQDTRISLMVIVNIYNAYKL